MRSAALAFLVFAGPALAHEPAVQHAQAPGHDPLDCYCRAQGRIFAPGESVCLRTAEGGRIAECRMVINVMSWGITDRACPES
ncbi:MAG TPA: hypothetical protein VHG30_17350 [Microvirga sp.]|jgi:hypothetical protein|nr:hypothetical protein [Microvirga sp.]